MGRRPNIRRTAAALAVAAALAALTVSGPAASASAPASAPGAAGAGCGHPRIETLPHLPPGNPPVQDDNVHDLASADLAVGDSAGVPAYWLHGRAHAVPLPAGFDTGTVWGVNRSGLMAGVIWSSADIMHSDRPFSYRVGARHLTILPSPTGEGYAYGVNARGEIVGQSQWPAVPLVWRGGHIERRLALPDLIDIGGNMAINDSGTVVGTLRSDDDTSNVAVWPAGSDTPVPSMQPTAYYSSWWDAPALDDHGRVAATLETGQGIQQAVYWDSPYAAPGTVEPPLPRHTSGCGFAAISPHTGVLVGTAAYSQDDDGLTVADVEAQLWPGHGPMLVLPAPEPGDQTTATAVADDGTAAGDVYRPDAGGVAVLWTCAPRQAHVPTP